MMGFYRPPIIYFCDWCKWEYLDPNKQLSPITIPKEDNPIYIEYSTHFVLHVWVSYLN